MKFIFQNPDYMKDNFFIEIRSLHVADKGQQENVSKSTLGQAIINI